MEAMRLEETNSVILNVSSSQILNSLQIVSTTSCSNFEYLIYCSSNYLSFPQWEMWRINWNRNNPVHATQLLLQCPPQSHFEQLTFPPSTQQFSWFSFLLAKRCKTIFVQMVKNRVVFNLRFTSQPQHEWVFAYCSIWEWRHRNLSPFHETHSLQISDVSTYPNPLMPATPINFGGLSAPEMQNTPLAVSLPYLKATGGPPLGEKYLIFCMIPVLTWNFRQNTRSHYCNVMEILTPSYTKICNKRNIQFITASV